MNSNLKMKTGFDLKMKMKLGNENENELGVQNELQNEK